MGTKNQDTAALVKSLTDQVMATYYDPLDFVTFAFPWGRAGTSLANETGPDDWQRKALILLGRQLKKAAGIIPAAEGEIVSSVVRLAVASGHGVGKTALVGWIILWFMSTRATPQAVITANTGIQLTTKTWRELSKWHQLSINYGWFEWTATSFKLLEQPSTWFATAIPWSEHNPTAFAGTHENDVLMIFDEASEIANIIWETAEGALTTADRTNTVIWLAFGNPTSNVGRFRQCWTKFKKRWITFQVDARTAKKANKALFEEWIEDYGEDSDFVRVRVKGQFPRTGPTQFIGNELVEAAQARTVNERHIANAIPKIIGIDVAREGDDASVLYRRWGPKLYDPIEWRIDDTMKLASFIAAKLNEYKPDVVFIDAIGIGAGVFDRLIQLGYDNVVACYAGNRKQTLDDHIYYNPRIEWWARMKEWLKTADLPAGQHEGTLYEDLIGPQFQYDINMKMRLERKEDMKKRGLASPDHGDALALTFAYPVPTKRDAYRQEDLEPEYT